MLTRISSSYGRLAAFFPAFFERAISKCPRFHIEVCRTRRKFLSTSSTILQRESTRIEDNVFLSAYGDNPIPDISFCEYALPYFEKYGKKTFLIDGVTGKSYSYHECLRCSLKVAASLKKLGAQKGDVVAICSVNRPEFVIAWFAANFLGAVLTETNPAFTAGELHNQLLRTEAKFIFVGSEVVNVAREALQTLPNAKVNIVFGEAEGFLPFNSLLHTDEPISSSCADVEPTSVAQIPFSSGTTGLPKGVLLTNRGLIGATLSSTHEGVVLSGCDDITVVVLPLFHTFGSIYIRCSLVVGTTVILLPRFTPESLLSTIQNYKATVLPVVPPLVLFLTQSPLVAKYDLSSLKKISCGAAPVAHEHFQSLAEKLKLEHLRQVYGMTELCPITMPSRTKGVNEFLDSVGKSACGVDVKIIDPENGRKLPVGQKGEICARSNFTMAGYLNNPKATEDTIDKEGWLHTGDVGFFSKDGNLYVVDRIKELIKYKGHQVAPAELEALLLQHPAIKDVAVVGVRDDKAGELPKAFVVLENASAETSEIDIQNFVAERTIDENRLRGGVAFIDAIPKSPSGKILRRFLTKR